MKKIHYGTLALLTLMAFNVNAEVKNEAKHDDYFSHALNYEPMPIQSVSVNYDNYLKNRVESKKVDVNLREDSKSFIEQETFKDKSSTYGFKGSSYPKVDIFNVNKKEYKSLGKNSLFEFEHGKASFYGYGFHGRRTASGAVFNANEMTAAHKTLPFGTKVIVEHIKTGKQILVKITDRGPFIAGRIIDLSTAAAKALGIYNAGVAAVKIKRHTAEAKNDSFSSEIGGIEIR